MLLLWRKLLSTISETQLAHIQALMHITQDINYFSFSILISAVESKHIGESRSVTEITTKEILPLFKGQNIPPGTVGRPCIQNSKMETVTKPSLVSSALDISQKKAMPSRRRSIKSGQNKCLLCCLPCQNCFRSIKSFFRKHSSSNNTLTSVKQLDEITNTDRLVTSLVPNNDSIEIETWV